MNIALLISRSFVGFGLWLSPTWFFLYRPSPAKRVGFVTYATCVSGRYYQIPLWFPNCVQSFASASTGVGSVFNRGTDEWLATLRDSTKFQILAAEHKR
ncbi:hypothetical protein LZ30DRAFT_696942 [Colletotrichum cereale]|nr:hypothetical protein LZ30DRAFT_696942 [Colletotrichum cereale]